ncbi:histidine kinase [Chitinophaga horti]|uniref:Histidine kinase n=1 Tax=Chitinophaga horti TaxID=2920382 RepID=A0ABY6J696_9BACT|nr:histidine kinase [Chitinophaga horti]UYQ95209.1 histidine kinase [Chitinophaga horti]
MMRLILQWKLHHVLFWTTFFMVWLLLRFDDYPAMAPTILAGLLKVLSLAAAVYFTNYVLIPQLLYTRRYLLFALAFTILVVITGMVIIRLLNLILLPYVMDIRKWPNATLGAQIYDVFIPLFFMVGAAAGIKFYLDRQKALRQSAEQELEYLRAQMNPHSLFNSLNAIYFLIDKENKTARDTLMQFSGLLRYQLYDANTPRIAIEKELEYLRSYVDIQRLRHDSHYDIAFTCDGDVRGMEIAPMLLIPFIENVFKHLSSHAPGMNTASIRISRYRQGVRLETFNTRDQQTVTTGGIGLANAKRRLALLYPQRHQLEIETTADTYSVILDITLL